MLLARNSASYMSVDYKTSGGMGLLRVGGVGDGSGGVAGWKTCVSISAIYLHPYGTNRAKCWKIGKLGKVGG
jgi:hypothetical protein